MLGDETPYDAAMALIERAGINSVPGDIFYACPDNVRSIRFHFAVDDEVLDTVCTRLASLS